MQKVIYLTTFFFIIIGTTAAQTQDSSRVVNLKPVNIESQKGGMERLQEIEGTSLFSGKKNEVIRLSAIDGNKTNNNSRQLFARVPGVSIWENDGSGVQISIAVRGLNPNRSWEFNTRQNGYDISSDVFGYPEAYYNPPIEAVEKIQIVRGGAALQYGSQFGGLLNYQLKRENQDKPVTFQSQNNVGSNGLYSSFNAIGGNSKKWNYYAYNHYRKGNGWRNNGQFEVRNSNGYLKYKINNNNSISAEYTNMNYEIQQPGGLTDLQFNENSQQSFRKRNWFSTPWNIAALNYDSKINENLSVNAKVFGLIGERNSIGFTAAANIKDTINTTINNYNNRQLDRDFYKNIGAEIRGIYSYQIAKTKQNMAFGGRIYQANTIRKQKGKGDNGFDYNTNLVNDIYPTELAFKTLNYALFIENQFKITNNFSITPGFRFEKISSEINGRLSTSNGIEQNASPNRIDRNIVLGGISASYKLKSTDIYANISQSYRPVLFSDLTPPATTDVIDPNLKDANGFNADFGYRGNFKNYLSFDIGAFYIQYNDRIGNLNKFIDDNPANKTYVYRTNLGKSSNKGIEAYLDFNITKIFIKNSQFGNLNLFASLAFINATYDDFKITSVKSGTSIINEDNLKGKKVENAPSYIHNLGVNYAKNGISVTLQTRITSDVFADATNTETPNTAGTIGKISGYQIYDFSSEYTFQKTYSVRFSINNLMDLSYATRRATGYPGPGLIPGEGRTFTFGFGIKL